MHLKIEENMRSRSTKAQGTSSDGTCVTHTTLRWRSLQRFDGGPSHRSGCTALGLAYLTVVYCAPL